MKRLLLWLLVATMATTLYGQRVEIKRGSGDTNYLSTYFVNTNGFNANQFSVGTSGGNATVQVKNGALLTNTVNYGFVELPLTSPAPALSSATTIRYYFDGTVIKASSAGSAYQTLGVAGSDTQVQYNDSGFPGADAGMTYAKATSTLSLSGGLNVGGSVFKVGTTGTTNTGNASVAGVANFGGAVTVTNNLSVGGGAFVVGTTGTTNTGNSTIAGTLGVGGVATFTNSVNVGGGVFIANSSGTVNTGNSTIAGTLGVGGVATFTNVVTASGGLTIGSSGSTNSSLTASTILAADANKKVISVANGTANQVLGMNSGATGQEFKTIAGTANQVTVTHGANTVTLSTPQDIGTGSAVTHARLTLASPTADTTQIDASGFLLDGANTQTAFSFAGTWNSSGTPGTFFKVAVTDTAHAGSPNIFQVLGGASGTTSELALSSAGALTLNGSVTSGGSVQAASSSSFVVNGRSRLLSAADGRFNFQNNANSSFTRLTLGLESSSFPAFAVNGAEVQVIAGDGSTAANLAVTGALKVGGTATANQVSKVLQVPATTIDPANVTAGNSTSATITVTGAAVGDSVFLGMPDTWANSLMIIKWTVSATDTVKIYFFNPNTVNAIDLPSASVKGFVMQQ